MAKNNNSKSQKGSFKKTGKLFGVISIIDILVVLCIAALAFGIYARYTSDSDANTATERSKFQYVYKVEGVREYTLEALRKGGPVYDRETKEYIGDVVSVSAEDAKMEISKISGEYAVVTVPERYDAYVTIEVDGKYNSLGHYTDANRYIGAGQTLNALSKFSNTEGQIIEVKDVE